MLENAEIIKKLQSVLSNKRYLHTISVAKEAVNLAKTHDADAFRAETAGLLHDCAKSMPDSLKLSLCHEFHIQLDEPMLEQPDLTHSFLGAEIAAREYGVTDPEILDAIRYHTTGRPGMCVLEKIIYLADFFEPNRKPYDSMYKIRELSYKDLDAAMVFTLKESVKYIRKKGLKIHNLTNEALEYYIRTVKEE